MSIFPTHVLLFSCIDDNGLDGAIPTEIGTLSRLQILDLSECIEKDNMRQ